MIRVVGDFNPGNSTHIATDSALQSLAPQIQFDWLGTDEISARWSEIEGASGIFIAPASPYRDAEAVLDVIRHARERGVPLVGT